MTCVDSKVWLNKWAALKARGIDGFVVGVKPSEHTGPVTFDWFCPVCGALIVENCGEVTKKEHADFLVHVLIHHDRNFQKLFTQGLFGEGI